MKTGAPINEVIIPTGISDGAITVRDIKSENTRKIEPKTIENGIENLQSAPIIKRAILGIISPTNEIIPATATAEAANNDEIIIDKI